MRINKTGKPWLVCGEAAIIDKGKCDESECYIVNVEIMDDGQYTYDVVVVNAVGYETQRNNIFEHRLERLL